MRSSKEKFQYCDSNRENEELDNALKLHLFLGYGMLRMESAHTHSPDTRNRFTV
jgi:hypothetical protein